MDLFFLHCFPDLMALIMGRLDEMQQQQRQKRADIVAKLEGE